MAHHWVKFHDGRICEHCRKIQLRDEFVDDPEDRCAPDKAPTSPSADDGKPPDRG